MSIKQLLRIDDAELLELSEELVAELSRVHRDRWVELRSFVFRAERLLRKLANQHSISAQFIQLKQKG